MSSDFRLNRISKAFQCLDSFICSQNVKQILNNYKSINEWLDIDPQKFIFDSNNTESTRVSSFDYFTLIRNRLMTRASQSSSHNKWFRVSSTLNKLEKRSNRKQYFNSTTNERCLRGCRVLVIGGGLSGLRVAIELCMLGACVLIVEKRTQFTRNNVIHLWPSVIADIHSLGGKRFYARFCCGSIDHVSIRSLQTILLKVALLFGAYFAPGVAFDQLCPQVMCQSLTSEPNTDCESDTCDCCCHEHRLNNGLSGARAHFRVTDSGSASDSLRSLCASIGFDVVIGCDGRRNTLSNDFPRKEFRGRLAIAITANFVNNKTESEARVKEISGVSYIYAQQWFQQLYNETGIQLENICYYRDETHYFVMTATKKSLLSKRVLISDFSDTRSLLQTNNISRAALLSFAREACEWTSGLSSLEFALNSSQSADVSLFDFTSVYAARNASKAKLIYDYCIKCNAHALSSQPKYVLTMLCGDSLLEPFWPTGSGAGRGFLAALDCAWTTRQWIYALNATKTEHESIRRDALLDVIAERESVYRLLAQTTPENVSPNAAINESGLNPERRYRDYNSRAKHEIKRQVSHLCPHVSTDEHNASAMSTSSLIDERDNDADDRVLRASALAAKRQRRITVAITPKHYNTTNDDLTHVSSQPQTSAKRDWLLGNQTDYDVISGNHSQHLRSNDFEARVRDFESTQTKARAMRTNTCDEFNTVSTRAHKSREIETRAKELEHVLESATQRFEPVLQRVAKLDVSRDWNFKIWTQNQLYVSPKPLVSAPTRAQQDSVIHRSRVQSMEKKLNESLNDTSRDNQIETRVVTKQWIQTLSEELEKRGLNTNNTDSQPKPTTPTPPTPPINVCIRCNKEIDSLLDRISISNGLLIHRKCLFCRVCRVSLQQTDIDLNDFLCVLCFNARNHRNNNSYKHMNDVTRAKSV